MPTPCEDPRLMALMARMSAQEQEAIFEAQGAATNFRYLGNQAYGRGKYDSAITFYNLAIACEEQNSRECRIAALANRAQTFLCMERPDKAIEDARAVLEMEPNHLKARFRLGRALFMLKQFTEAQTEFEKCLELEPTNQEVQQQIHECVAASSSSSARVDNLATAAVVGKPETAQSSTMRSSKLTAAAAAAAEPQTSTGSGPAPQNDGPPRFGFQQLLMRPWWPMKAEQFALASLDGGVREFSTLHQLRVALGVGASAGPIAQIRLEQCELMSGKYIEFFKSLDTNLREGGSLELYGVRGGDAHFVQFLRLFKPISVHIASYEDYTWDICSALKNVDPIREAKHLMLHPRFAEDQGRMICAKLTTQSVLVWVHSTRSSPTPSAPIWAPPVPAGQARLVDVQLGSTTDQDLDPAVELANVWRSPAAKMLLFHAGALGGGGKCVERFIGECRKLFDQSTNQLNYSIKVMVQSGGGQRIKPRSLTNGMGEQLRVSVQKLTLDGYVETDYFPPHELVIIERFHTA